MRQIILDTETTGLEPSQGHRIIEIGCVEVIERATTGNNYHQYINPEREVDQGAIEVHGISNEFLQDKPRFIDIVDDFIAYIEGAELIIHNAPFDVGFIDNELKLAEKELGKTYKRVADYCKVTDSLVMARQLRPGKKNNLDALCDFYGVDNSSRDLHGALLDAEILWDVYRLMTGGQGDLSFNRSKSESQTSSDNRIRRLSDSRNPLPIIRADEQELNDHKAWCEKLELEW